MSEFDFSDLNSDNANGLDFSDLNSDNQAPAAEKTPPTKSESLLRGAVQGSSFGFGDELAGSIGGLLELLPGSATRQDEALRQKFTDENAGQQLDMPASPSYESIRNEERVLNEQAQQANPGTYLAGNVVGGALTAPATGLTAIKGAGALAKLGNATVQGARAGAIGGLGTSDADNVAQMIEDTGTGSAIGGAVGFGTQGVLAGTQKLGTELANKMPSTVRAYEKGLEGIKTFSDEFAKDVSKKSKVVVDKVTGVLQRSKENQNKIQQGLLQDIDSQIDDIVKNVETNNAKTSKFLGSVKDERASALEQSKGNLVTKLQDQFGQAKKAIGANYDKIEAEIPEGTTFSVADNVYNLQKDLEVIAGKLPQEADAIVKQFAEAKKIDALNFLELKNLRKDAAAYLEASDPGIKKAFSNFSKNLNNTRAQQLRSNPLTAELADTLAETDARYAAALDLEENFLGRVNYDKNLNQVYTDRITRQNLPNKQANTTVKSLTKNDFEKAAEYQELLQKLQLTDPKLRQSMQPEFESLIQEDLALKNLDTKVASPKAVLEENPDILRLKKLQEELQKPQTIKTKTDEILAGSVEDEKSVRDFLTNNLKNLDNPVNSSSKADMEDLLNTYNKLSGENISQEALDLVKDTNLVKQSASEKPIIIGNPVNTIQRVGGYIANIAGQMKRAGNEATATIRNVTTDDIGNVLQNLKMVGTPEASIYAKQLSDAAAKGPEARNAVMFSLMQQPGYRAIMNNNKQEEKEK